MRNKCLSGLTGEIVVPTNPNYEKDRQLWNLAIQKFPSVIVYCYVRDDVRNAICWARKNRVSIRVRSGGHNYEGYSTGDGVIVIDIERMNSLQLNDCKKTLKIEGGVQNAQVYNLLGSHGYPFPGGTCPTVGACGYTLGGGWGFSSRLFGLGCDSLIEIELMNYRGEILVANKCCHSDLFWACRGAGGGNFGIVLSMTFSLPPKVEKVTLFSFYYPNASTEKMISFWDVWQKWLPTADNRVCLNTSIYNSLEEGMAIYGRGIFYGTTEEARVAIEPLLRLDGGESSFQYVTFLEATTKISDGYPPSEKFKSTGRFVKAEYSLEELNSMVSLIAERAPGSIYAALTLYALGGKVKDTPKKETAFYYRDATYIVGIQSVWLEDQYKQENIQWVVSRFPVVESLTVGSFINFPYGELIDYGTAYYGGNYERLKRVNNKYDPYHVFTYPQGIN